MKLKYISLTFFIIMSSIFILFISPSYFVSAEDNSYNISEDNDPYNFSTLEPYFSDNLKDILGIENLEYSDIYNLKNIDLSELLKYILNKIEDEVHKPIVFLITILIILTLSSIISKSSNLICNDLLSDRLCLIVIVITVHKFFYSYFEDMSNVIDQCTEFFTVFVPVFASTLFATGGTATMSGYSLILLSITDMIIQVSHYILLPFLNICFALAICDSINPFFSFNNIIKYIHKFIQSAIKIFLSIFSGILSLQTILNTNTDGIGSKTVKMILSGSIPVVGSAISDAYGSVKASIEILRSGLGIIAIIILIMYALPIIIKFVICKITFSVAAIVSGLYEKNRFASFFDTLEKIYSIAYAVIITVFATFIISVAIVLFIVKG